MLRLFLEGHGLDTDKSFKVNMTYLTIDLAEPQAKLNSFSKTVTIPGTPNNNRILGLIYRFDKFIIDSDSAIGASFDPNRRINFVLQDNETVMETGYAQLDKINNKAGLISYDFTLYGGIGNFFYSLKYDSAGNERLLSDLYYGLERIQDSEPLSKEQEDTAILFDFNKEFVKDCWNTRMSEDTYYTTKDSKISKFVCPIPTYLGFYDNFDSDKILVNKYVTAKETAGSGAGDFDPCNAPEVVTEDDEQKIYADYEGWNLVLLNREVNEYEINDIRSHYQRYGVRLKNIYDAIKNPDNNGGFTVNDDNVKAIEKEYINNCYVLFNRIQWDDSNVQGTQVSIPLNNWNKNLSFTVDTDLCNTAVFDLSDYNNAGAVVYVTPKLNFATPIPELKTRGINTNSNAYIKPCYMENVQYFYLEAKDDNGNLLKTSDIYFYNDNDIDDNAAGTFLSGLTTENKEVIYSMTGIGIKMMSLIEWTLYDTDPLPQLLDKLGKKLYTPYTYVAAGKSYYTTNKNDVNTVNVNYKNLWKGYKTNTGYGVSNDTEWVGEPILMYIDLSKISDKSKVRIYLNAGTIFATTNIHIEKLDKYTNDYSRTPETTVVYSFQAIDKYVSSGYTYNGHYYGTIKLNTNTLTQTPRIGSINESENSMIFDGGIESISESHTVTKQILLSKAGTPFDYLLNLAKLFNWKLQQDDYTGVINIYSNNRYYQNKIVNIDGLLDRKSYSIIPHTALYTNYMLGLNKVESYPLSLYDKQYKKDYGTYTKNTSYLFGDTSNNIFEENIFEHAIPYLHRSVYYNDEGTESVLFGTRYYDIPGIKYSRPALGKNVTVTLYRTDATGLSADLEDTMEVVRPGRLLVESGTTSQNVTDSVYKLSFFDSEFKNLEDDNIMVFFDLLKSDSQTTKVYQISDNVQACSLLNDNNCYIYVRPDVVKGGEIAVTTDVINGIVNTPVWHTTKIPVFDNKFIYNSEYYSILFDDVNDNTDNIIHNSLYDLSWKRYIDDLYNKNNKVVTIKFKMLMKPKEALRMFYQFDNAIWIINKIDNYNIDNKNEFTTCEFIQVLSVNSYIN